jgi:hypothetical protein
LLILKRSGANGPRANDKYSDADRAMKDRVAPCNSVWMQSFIKLWSMSVMDALTDPEFHLPIRRIVGGPRVSFIMPTFSRSHPIRESICSLLDGEYQDFDLLVGEDGKGQTEPWRVLLQQRIRLKDSSQT